MRRFLCFYGMNTHSNCVLFLTVCLLAGCLRVAVGLGNGIHTVSGYLECEIFNNFIIYFL